MWIKQLAVSSGMPSEAMQAYDKQAGNVLSRVEGMATIRRYALQRITAIMHTST
jgi:hypothetical protein